MRNITRDNLKYTGIVTLSQYIDGQKMLIKKIQNEGGKSLFDFFTDCLMGEFDLAKFKRPVKIKLLSLEGSEYFSKSSFIYLLSRPEKIP